VPRPTFTTFCLQFPDRPMWRRSVYWLLLLSSAMSACSSNHYYLESELALNTSGYYGLLDHIASYYPSGVSLNFPGYIVGFEESARSRVLAENDRLLIDESVFAAGFTVKRLTKALKYSLPFVSHIVRYRGKPYGEGNCALYNLYRYNGSALIDYCTDVEGTETVANEDYRSSFHNSWRAIDLLKRSLRQDLESGSYTHLVVAVMGLDTAQEEAIRNYKSIISSIRKNSGAAFKPLFIGITWPSFFANRWFDPLWEALAYPPIADRADTLGLTWMGVLMNQVVLPLSERMNVSVIGHSFGARAASMSLCVGPVIQRPGAAESKPDSAWHVDNFIGLAPAFSLRRFIDKDYLFYENVYYRDHCPAVDRFVFTASSKDSAFTPLFWNDPVGDAGYMVEYCGKAHAVTFACTAAAADGSVGTFSKSAKITYIDTSRLMTFTMPGTKGGGHSDIFRPQIGKLLWRVIDGGGE